MCYQMENKNGQREQSDVPGTHPLHSAPRLNSKSQTLGDPEK